MKTLLLVLALALNLHGQGVPGIGGLGALGAHGGGAGGISFDAATDGSFCLSCSSLSWTHTTSGSGRILWVGIYGSTQSVDATCVNVTGVTYNSVSMTLAQTAIPGLGTERCAYLFYLAGPASGSNTVVVSASGSLVVIAGISVSYAGAKATGIPDAHTSNFVNNTSLTTTITTVASNAWAVSYTRNSNAPPSAGTGCTARITAAASIFCDSNTALSPGANSITVNGTGSGTMNTAMASFPPGP